MLNRPHHIHPAPESVRVALVYRDFSESCVSHVGLGISAAYTAKTLRHNGIWSEVWPTKSVQALAERIRNSHGRSCEHGEVRPSHVILLAPWILTRDLAQMAIEFPDINFVVVSHSTVGFLSADPHAIRLLRETADLQIGTHNVFVAGNSKKFTDWATQAWNVNAVWLPNLYYMSERTWHSKRPWPGCYLRMGIFGANRPLKNFLSGAACAVELASRLQIPTELFFSSGRDEGGNWRALNEMTENVPNLTVYKEGWLSWPRFRALVRTMDLVFQVSYTETFNVVAADAIAEGVPVVASEAIDWLPSMFHAKADNPTEIASVAERLLRDPNAVRHGKEALARYVEHGVRTWLDFLVPQIPSAKDAKR